MKENDKNRARALRAGNYNTSTEDESGLKVAFMAGLFALPVSLGIGLALLLAMSLAAYSNSDPDKLISPLGISALILTSVLCGFISARRGGRAIALCGLMGGGLFSALLFVLSWLFSDESRASLSLGASNGVSLLLHIGVILLALVGAILSDAIKSSSPKKKRRR